MEKALQSSHYQKAIAKIIEGYNGTSILGLSNEEAAFEIYKYILETAELINLTPDVNLEPNDLIRVTGYVKTPDNSLHYCEGTLMTLLSIKGDLVTFGVSKNDTYEAHVNQCQKVRLY